MPGGDKPARPTGRPPGSRTVNRTAGARTGRRAGHQQSPPPNLGPPVRLNPWAVAAPAAAPTQQSVPLDPPPASPPSAAEGGPSVQGGSSVPSSPPGPPVLAAHPPVPGSPSDPPVLAAHPPVPGSPSDPPVLAVPATFPRGADGRFGAKPSHGSDGAVQRKFREKVKAEVNRRVHRTGHGTKGGLTGSLRHGSCWFFPDDMQRSPVPDRDTHLTTACYLVCHEMLDGDITAPPCPFCGRFEDVVSDGWHSTTRLVHGENYNYELIGFQHKCTACEDKQKGEKAKDEDGYKFAPWHPGVLSRLPRDVLEAFPALILPQSAVDRRLITRIEQTVVSKGGFQTLANHLDEAHKVEFHRREIRYTFRMARKRRQNQATVVAADNEALRNPPRFGGFYDKDGYNGKPPSASVLRGAWDVTWESRKEYYRRSAQLVDGDNIAVDESHKLVKGIRVDNSKVFHGIFTVINQHNQVVAQAPKASVTVGSLEEVKPMLRALQTRYEKLNFDKIKVVFSDNCDMDRAALQETLGPASVADPDKSSSPPASVEQASSLPRLTFPADMTPNVIVVRSEACRNSALACDQLVDFAIESARHIPGNRPVLGFDCEWVPSLRGRGKVALVQLSCLDGYTVIFRLKIRGGSEAGVFPKALKELMENEEVELAGVGATADIGRIKTDFGVNGTGAVDVGVLAGKHLGVAVGERSLAALVASLLSRLLFKGSVRTSDWEQETLSPEQINYAGLDAFAAALLHRHVMERVDPVFVLPQPGAADLATDTLLRLYTRTNTRCIAEGTVVDYTTAGTFGKTELAVGKRPSSDRVVVRLTTIRVPGAFALHPSEAGTQPPTLEALGVQTCALWETRNVRLPPVPPPQHHIPGSDAVVEIAPPTPASRTVPKPEVLLDFWHAMHRLLECARKTHGAYWPFCIALANAMSIVNPRALEDVRLAVARLHPAWEPWEVQLFLRQNYATIVLKHVTRFIPPPEILVLRYDAVMALFRYILDSATGDAFFTPRLEKAVANLRPHLVQGCLSDPSPQFLPLYCCKGRSAKLGLPTFRSTRGTNRVETYHRFLGLILGGHRTAPHLASSITVVHNHRRNHRMAVKYRGLPAELANVFDGWTIEDIQEASLGLHEKPLYPSWESTKNYQDTGEHVGFASIPPQGVPPTSDIVIDEEGGEGEGEEWEDVETSEVQDEEGFDESNMTRSARIFAQMQGGELGTRPFTAVLTQAEKHKFNRSVLSFLVTSPRSSNRPPTQDFDWDAFAQKWNENVTEEERQERDGLLETDEHNLVNRKHPNQLKLHMNTSKRAVNSERTMQPHKGALAQLQKSHRVEVQPNTSSQGFGQGACIGVLQGGETISFPAFPSAADASRVQPRPPLAFSSSSSTSAGCGRGGGTSGGVAGEEGGVRGVGATSCIPDSGVPSESGSLVEREGAGGGGWQPRGGDGIEAQALGRGQGVSGVGDRLGGVAVGSSGGQAAASGSGRSIVGDPCFVMPIKGCATLRAVAPTFGVSTPLQQPWNPLYVEQAVAARKPAPTPRAPPTCQQCGHLYTIGGFANLASHQRAPGRNGRTTCLVPLDSRRQPDHPSRAKRRFDTCTCLVCVAQGPQG